MLQDGFISLSPFRPLRTDSEGTFLFAAAVLFFFLNQDEFQPLQLVYLNK